MRRFIVYAPGHDGRFNKAWEDTGFSLKHFDTDLDGGQRPDIVFWNHHQVNLNMIWHQVLQLTPKIFVAVSSHKIPVPGFILETYREQQMEGDGLCFCLGSTIEGKLEIPLWDAWVSKDQLSHGDQVKALAGSVYRYLLEDVFRETADWCGHMSSVVGPMG